MSTSGRLFAILIWLGGISVTGSIALMIAASRIGEHKSSTYGNAYRQFQDSWGGEIEILPPEFFLERTFAVTIFDSLAKKDKQITKSERLALIPKSIKIGSKIHYDEQELGFLCSAFSGAFYVGYLCVFTDPRNQISFAPLFVLGFNKCFLFFVCGLFDSVF